ncbi:MAG: prepilin-type N-terminal cleavage/methylation domain-containing protein [Candidatus Liptonbacteria bacterium]|nr:prepilin-type N-terminal cleavage/methylation domain-containing protein [Candidatus Liptonbacteria bacterium]
MNKNRANTIDRFLNRLVSFVSHISSLVSPRAKYASRAGFTLIEMLVAITLFAITVSIAMGGLAIALRSQRRVAALISANNNMSLVFEQMAREIRTGSNFCRPSCPAGEIDFINAASESVVYRLNNGTIERAVQGPGGIYNFSPVTGTNVSIQYLNFILFGNLAGDSWPPRITISVGVTAKGIGIPIDVVNLQTTISARELDS